MISITSRENPLVQHLKKLLSSRSYRYEQGLFVCDGVKLLKEALKWNADIDTVVALEGLELPALPAEVRLVTVPESLMKSLSRMEAPQGVLTVCRMPEQKPARPCRGCLVLDGIQDPGNVGTILRTADALDVPVILSEGCADPFSEKTVRASMGAVLRTAPVQGTKAQIIEACREESLPVCVTALSERARDIRKLKLGDCVNVIGSEGKGVCCEYFAAAAAEAIIPMSERCESLNASVAAAIVMWQMKA